MTDFTISSLAATIAEGGTYSFSITPSKALASAITVRWEIVQKGKIPISSNDFSALKGEVDFAASATLAQTISIIAPEDTVREVTKTFEIRIYQVTEADDSSTKETGNGLPNAEVTGNANDSDTTKTDDVLLGAQTVTLTDNDEGDFGSLSVDGSVENNVFGVSGTTKIAPNGGANNDAYVVTRFQFGDVTISDSAGSNLIKFDYGVSITGYDETSFINGRRITEVSLTLSTGTVVTIISPASEFDFQLGADAVITTYAAFKTAIGASGTNTASALAKTKTIDSFTSAPDISSNVGGSRRALNGTEHADVIGFGGDFDFSANGIGGDDTYVITRFQSGNVTINDIFGASIVKFDFGVSITDFAEVSQRGGRQIRSVTLTLSTGAEIVIAGPAGGFSYQLGDEAVISSYADFKTAIGASGTNATSALAATYITDFATIGTVSITHIETINPAPTANVGETLTAVTTGLTDANDTNLDFTYQWKLGGTDITGATDATYTTTAAGIYTVDVRATDDVNKVTTDFTSARFQVGPKVIDTSAYTELKIGAGALADTLDASAATGRQLIQGGAGDDIITASAHGDVITGGYGADTITLGAGVDRVVYRINGAESRAVDGGDTINNFKLGTDKWIFADTDGVSFRAATMATLLDGSVVGNGNVQLTRNANKAVSGFEVNLGDGRLTVKYSTDQNLYDLLGIADGDITALKLAVEIPTRSFEIIDTTKIINLFGGDAFIDFVDYSTPEDTNLGFEIL